MDNYSKIDGLKIAGHDIYIKNAPNSADKVGIVIRDLMIANLKAKAVETNEVAE